MDPLKERRVNFDPVARVYRWLEYLTFGPFLKRCRMAQIHALKDARRALVLGDGDGRFLARLLKENTRVTAEVVDSSHSMLVLLQNRIRRQGLDSWRRIRVHHADALAWKPAGQYDLFVTHFFLDCFSTAELEGMLDRLLAHAAPGARWIISEFATPRSSWMARAIVFCLYCAFGRLTGLPVRRLPDYAGILLQHGWTVERERTFLWGLLRSQLCVAPAHDAVAAAPHP